MFLNDSAFLPFNANKRDEADRFQRDLYDYNAFRQDQLKETSFADLQGYHQRQTRIAVKKFTGKLDPTVKVKEDVRDGRGLSLRFTLKKEKNSGKPP